MLLVPTGWYESLIMIWDTLTFAFELAEWMAEVVDVTQAFAVAWFTL